MKRKHLPIIFLALMAIGVNPLRAQVDPHFSQVYLHPMTLNPAYTGAFEGDYRATGIWRSQYGNTLTTQGISGEVATNKSANFGFNLLNESSQDKSYNFTNGYLTMAFTGVQLGRNADHYLVMAIQFGFINRRFDITKLQFGDQWVQGMGFDPTQSSGEVFNKPSITAFDAGAGIAYYDAVPNKTVSFFGGFSAFHITRPDYPYLSNSKEQRLPVRFSLQAGARIIASDLWSIVPSVILMKEAEAEEKMLGAYLQLYANENTDVMFGANWRLGDALIPFAGFYYKGLTLGLSYDVTISSLNSGAVKSNSFEVSISFVGQRKNSMRTNNFYCPRF
jgi:type IX secretion system PorP/SprF family membrane protein